MPGDSGTSSAAPAAAAGQAPPAGAAAPAGQEQPPAGDTTGQAPAEGGDDEPMTLGEARKLRREAATLRDRLAELDRAEQERRQASMTELEKVTAKATTLEQELAQARQELADERLGRSIEATASRLGFANPDDAYRLLDRKALELDDDGRPKALDKALQELLRARPYLAATRVTGGADAGTGNGTGGGARPSMNDLIRGAAGKGGRTRS